MIGLDLVEIGRIERALERRPRLARRLFTEGELEFAEQRARPGLHLAARFAAKEAALKALGTAVPLREVEIEGGGSKPPTLRLHGAAAARALHAGLELDVSLTHTRDHAAAVVHARPSAGG